MRRTHASAFWAPAPSRPAARPAPHRLPHDTATQPAHTTLPPQLKPPRSHGHPTHSSGQRNPTQIEALSAFAGMACGNAPHPHATPAVCSGGLIIVVLISSQLKFIPGMPRVLPRLVASCLGVQVRETNDQMIHRDRHRFRSLPSTLSGMPGCPTLGGAGRSWRHHPTGQTASATGGEGNKELFASLLVRATAVAARAAAGRTAAVIPGNTRKPHQGHPAADNPIRAPACAHPPRVALLAVARAHGTALPDPHCPLATGLCRRTVPGGKGRANAAVGAVCSRAGAALVVGSHCAGGFDIVT